MSISTFLHDNHESPTTLSEIRRVHDWVGTEDFLGVYAYATQSGVSSFDLELGAEFWSNTPSRWLFGLDYGRTQPQALRFMSENKNAEIRVFDGAFVAAQTGFVPRRDFHAKMSLLLNPGAVRFGMVVGSGNFSSNGLRRSIEAGAVLCLENENEFADSIGLTANLATTLWDNATPLAGVFGEYEEKWRSTISRVIDEELLAEAVVPGPYFGLKLGTLLKTAVRIVPGIKLICQEAWGATSA